jgi:thiamine pyrophosphokinase
MCNGGIPPEKILTESLAGTGLVIGADGGGNILLDLNVVPHVVIGDLDSFRSGQGDEIRKTQHHAVHRYEAGPAGTPVGKDLNFELIHDPDQETNDLEKALKLALDRGATEAVILGATGLRLDHTLKNLSVLLQFSGRFRDILLRDATCDIRILPRAFTMETRPGQTISLFPLSGRVDGITTEGLRYALNDEPLENGVRDGSSNAATGKQIHIGHRSGDLMLITPHHQTD